MTNYNERLDEALALIKYSVEYRETHGGCPPKVSAIKRHGIAEAKQAIKQLVADEMLELIGNDLQPLPNGYMPESHDNVNNRLAIQRAKLAEWRAYDR